MSLKNIFTKTFSIIFLLSCLILSAQSKSLVWEEDLTELISNIENCHPNPYAHISKQEFYQLVDKLRSSFSDNEIENQIRMMKLVSSLRDRHTVLFPNESFTNWLPISIYKFEDGFHIISTIEKYKELLGAKILSFNNTLSNDVFELTADLYSSDNDIGRQLNTYYMSNMNVLNYFDIANNNTNINLKVELPNGNQETTSIESINLSRRLHVVLDQSEFFGPMDKDLFSDYLLAYKGLNIKKYYYQPINEKKNIPHFLRNRRGYWYDYLETNKTMYIAICFSTNNGRNGFNDFNTFLTEVFSKIDNNPTEKVILDIRFNPGGDGSTTLPLIHEFIKRDTINKKGRLFTLTGRKTYSAAQMIYAEMLKHTNTILVGEPAGAPVNGYGDPLSYKLNNSKMYYQVSSAYWQMGHPNDTSWVQKIDLPFVFKSDDYINGRDRALEYILSLDGDYLTLPNILINNDISSFKREYNIRKKRFGIYNWWKPFDEREMRYAARNLFDEGFHEKGYLGFEALIEMYPNSWRGFRDYAERVIHAKNLNKGEELIKRGLKINPTSGDLKEMLKKLKQQPTKN